MPKQIPARFRFGREDVALTHDSALEAACLAAAGTLLDGQPLQPRPSDARICAVLPAGAAILRQLGPTIFELHRLAAKGHVGVGSKLLHEAAEHVQARGGTLLLAASTLPSVKFYRKHMKELAKEPLPDGVNCALVTDWAKEQAPLPVFWMIP